MSDLSARLQALQARIAANPSASELGALENEARALMTQAKNTEYEGQARDLFKQLAQRPTSSGGGEVSAELRALLRRAKIRVDVASDATDLRFLVAVRDTTHLDAVIRGLKRTQSVIHVQRTLPAS